VVWDEEPIRQIRVRKHLMVFVNDRQKPLANPEIKRGPENAIVVSVPENQAYVSSAKHR
jgi:hypothetical protein